MWLSLLGLLPLPAAADARDATAAATAITGPDELRLPSGYVSERVGKVRFVYPVAARDEARDLIGFQPDAWKAVTRELGASQVPSDLDIRIGRNPTEMQALAPKGAPLPGYADGIAFPERGLILLTLTAPETWLRPDMRRVLVHELSHVALQRAALGADLPRWFVEGVAMHQAGEGSFERMRTLWEGTLQGRLLPLERLSQAFPMQPKEVDLAYAQSADFVESMMNGADQRARFSVLIAQLGQRMAFADAVRLAYHVPLGYMEHEWRAQVTQRFGRWPALLMGLTFVWAIGALLLVVGYVRARRKHKRTLRRWEIEEATTGEHPSAPPPAPVRASQGAASAVAPQTATQTQGPVDEFFDNRRQQSDAGVPTIVHDGQSHTLH